MVVGEAERPRRQADHGPPAAGGLVEAGAKFAQQARELLAAPLHPGPIGGVGGRFPPCVGQKQGVGGVVVTQIHRPGEVVIQLDAIHSAALHDLSDQSDEAGAHPGVGGVQPHPQILERGGLQIGAVHRVEGAAIGSPQNPLRMATHHLGVARLHQAVFEPGDHLHAATLGGAGEAADRVEGGGVAGQGGLDRCPAAAVEGGTPAPDVWVEGVEARGGQLFHRRLDAAGVVVEGAGAVGQPHADATAHRLRQAAGAWLGHGHTGPGRRLQDAGQLQQGRERQGEAHG